MTQNYEADSGKFVVFDKSLYNWCAKQVHLHNIYDGPLLIKKYKKLMHISDYF